MHQSSTQNEQQTYVYKGTEVIKTGRVAEKIKSENTTRRIAGQQDQLHEIKPLSEQDGTWTEWVKDTDLYKILGVNDET